MEGFDDVETLKTGALTHALAETDAVKAAVDVRQVVGMGLYGEARGLLRGVLALVDVFSVEGDVETIAAVVVFSQELEAEMVLLVLHGLGQEVGNVLIANDRLFPVDHLNEFQQRLVGVLGRDFHHHVVTVVATSHHQGRLVAAFVDGEVEMDFTHADILAQDLLARADPLGTCPTFGRHQGRFKPGFLFGGGHLVSFVPHIHFPVVAGAGFQSRTGVGYAHRQVRIYLAGVVHILFLLQSLGRRGHHDAVGLLTGAVLLVVNHLPTEVGRLFHAQWVLLITCTQVHNGFLGPCSDVEGSNRSHQCN